MRRYREYTDYSEIADLIEETKELLNMGYVKICWAWNNKYTNRLGSAMENHPSRSLVQLSSQLWPYASPKERHDVIVHEVCHITVNVRHCRPVAHHGKEWKAEMILAGAKPIRCHNVVIPIQSFMK